MICLHSRDDFLCNQYNKQKLIFSLRLSENGFLVKVAEADADRDIVTVAVECSSESKPPLVVGKDTDLMVLLIYIAWRKGLQMYFKKPPTQLHAPILYDVTKIIKEFGPLCEIILFYHAFTGCDTTSAIYDIGKTKHLELLKNEHVRNEIAVFNQMDACREELTAAGEKFFLRVYKGDINSSLDNHRYSLYKKKVSRLSLKSKFFIGSLPPTSSAANQHSFRVYLQIQSWLGNHKNPEDWG